MPEIYKGFIGPILDRLDSEKWHVRTREALHLTEITPFGLELLERFVTYRGERFTDERLKVVVGGIEFDNPLMVGAGWDKVGHAVEALWQLGFSADVVGTAVPYPQEGTEERPRQFMIAPGVALNNLGFNSPGMRVITRNLDRYKGKGIPIGVSVSKNKEVPDVAAPQMYALVVYYLYDHGSFFEINVSSPNTPGLRRLQEKKQLAEIVFTVKEIMRAKGGVKPIFVKISPDSTVKVIDDVIEVAMLEGLGITAANTTDNPNIKAKYGERWRNQPGGLSGDDEDYRQMVNKIISYIYKQTHGKVEIIGVGGVKDTKTALDKIFAGASAIQVVTGLRGEFLTLPGRINRNLVKYMEKWGVQNISELVGQRI